MRGLFLKLKRKQQKLNKRSQSQNEAKGVMAKSDCRWSEDHPVWSEST